MTVKRVAVKRVAPRASLTEVLDRVLDRGIVIDAWLRVSLAGITLIDVDARVVVASINTYVQHSDAVAFAALASRPASPAPGPLPAPAPLPAPRRARRPRRKLRCDAGCTFVRRAKRCPVTVRCPSEHGRVCAVAVVPAAV
jgi:gas vesicle structural protein